MIRLMAVLGVFLFLAFEVLGADHGQFIHAPIAENHLLVIPAQTAAPKVPARAVFIPAQPVVKPVVKPVVEPVLPAPAQPQVAMGVTEAVATPADLAGKIAQDAMPTGTLMHAPVGANVRTGPSTTFPIAGKLVSGDEVLAVDQTSAPGWTRISVQGDGETGWVASRLLRK